MYSNQVLKISDGIGDAQTIVWELSLCLLFCWTLCFVVLVKGISSLGKVDVTSLKVVVEVAAALIAVKMYQ